MYFLKIVKSLHHFNKIMHTYCYYPISNLGKISKNIANKFQKMPQKAITNSSLSLSLSLLLYRGRHLTEQERVCVRHNQNNEPLRWFCIWAQWIWRTQWVLPTLWGPLWLSCRTEIAFCYNSPKTDFWVLCM